MESSHKVLIKLIRRFSRYGWLPFLLAAILIPISINNFLLFHTLTELFAITIAITSAIVAWHTFELIKNQFLLLLGCGYCVIGGLDIAHMLSFQGMPFVDNNSGNVSLQFSSSAKLFEAILLIIAPFLMGVEFKRKTLIIILTAITLLIFGAVAQNWLPVLYDEITGLTLSKILLEYLTIALLFVAVLSFWRVKKDIEANSFIVINISIILTILSGYALTLYSDFGDTMIIIGHIFKLFSYWTVYAVLIESSLRQPFLSLARDANTYDAVPDATIVVDRAGNVRQINAAVRSQLDNPEKAIGSRCHSLQHNPSIAEQDCPICMCISSGKVLNASEFFVGSNRQWYEVTLSPIVYGHKSLAMVHVRRNITVAKEALARSELYNRLYTVLSYTSKALAGAKSSQAMFTNICEIAFKHGGFKMAWIGLIEDDVLKPKAHRGGEADFLKMLEIRADDACHSFGPIGKAVQTHQVQCVNNIQLYPGHAPWGAAAEAKGYKAIAAVPLIDHQQVVGVYALYSEVADAFDDKILSLLDSLGRDISSALERLKEKKKHADSERKIQQLSQVVEQNSQAILITDTQFKIEYVNKAFTVLTGYLLHEIVNNTPAILRSKTEKQTTYEEISCTLRMGLKWHGQIRQQRKDGSIYWSLQTITPIKNNQGDVTHFVSASQDNTDLHDAQDTIEQLAFYDPLTNLPNRRLLSDRLQQALEHSHRAYDDIVVVMVLDLDNFKIVNDSLGHDYGDELLKQVAQILLSQVRKEDTVSRQGGDEFTIILAGMKNSRKVVDIASSILQMLSQPINVSGHQVVIGTSIGIAVYPEDASNCDELLRHADMAMYFAKEEGKNNFQFFTPSLNKQAHLRLQLENKLRQAIEKDHFQLFYQPQLDLVSGDIIGTEALIRWFDPEQGLISPAEFIPLAEETGLIGQIGDWVIETACREMKTLHDLGFPKVKVAVNVSAFQFRHGQHLIKVVSQSLEKYSYPPELFSLEVTESILIDDINETLNILKRMRELGIVLAIDDFGTGYSSLSYLKQFPIDILKIDQSFIRDITIDGSDKAIVSAIIAMAKQLGIEVLAEGVEALEHQQFLQTQGCDYAQGFLYCKPIPADELLRDWKTLVLAS
jgi:diguanylate cyclase (GGDEF)-like protein/PAS domain S-box-containing protein